MTNIDTSELKRLEEGLRRYESILPKSVASQALKRSARPMEQSARRLAPVGKTVSANGWGKYTGPKYARGGTTRRDIRFKFDKSENKATTRAMIGVSRLKIKVGWRTQFSTTGYTDRGGNWHRGKNFLKDAYDYTIGFVRENFGKESLLSFKKWAVRNLPQGKF